MTMLVLIGVVVVLACGLAGLVLAADTLLREMADTDDPHYRTSVDSSLGHDQFTQERRAALAQQQRRAR